jgi:hypothetical protein
MRVRTSTAKIYATIRPLLGGFALCGVTRSAFRCLVSGQVGSQRNLALKGEPEGNIVVERSYRKATPLAIERTAVVTDQRG